MKEKNVKKNFVLLFVVLAFSLVAAGTLLAEEPLNHSESPVYWTWDFISNPRNTDNPVGTSNLVRNKNGISAQFKSDALTPGHAVTLWFVVFNYPENCLAGPYKCSPMDMGDTAAKGDFLYAGGHVLGNGNFAGHLNVGDTSRSGLSEVRGCQNCTPGLIEPESALVILAIHDHGPALTGQALAGQISSFLGDCHNGSLGNMFGFATGPEDIPDEPHEAGMCSTIMHSPHKSLMLP
jgi:hypothetical protein